MALTIKQLNGDSSMLLSFEPTEPYPGQQPFRIVLDPWLSGPSHLPFASITNRQPACVVSLRDLPEPDLVIVSQSQADHCHEATLRQLPGDASAQTLILAEPGAARAIRGWKHFAKHRVRALERWEDPRVAGRETAARIVVPPHTLGGDPGEVTVAYIPQRRDPRGVQTAIAITYRPPPSRSLPFKRPSLTPPACPNTPIFDVAPRLPSPPLVTSNTTMFSKPLLNTSAPLFASPMATMDETSSSTQPLRSVRSAVPVPTHAGDRAISVIYAPHGISYSSIEPYATTHLLAEAALPLTTLLHCFNAVSNPWWFGGNVSRGLPAGQEIAAALGAQAWVSTHDGDKTIRGFAGRVVRTQRYQRDEIRRCLELASLAERLASPSKKPSPQTEVVVLAVGEEVSLTGEGVWVGGIETARSPTNPKPNRH